MLRAMVEFRNQDLSGSVFDDVDLTGARFINVLVRDVTIRGAWAERLEIDGGFERCSSTASTWCRSGARS